MHPRPVYSACKSNVVTFFSGRKLLSKSHQGLANAKTPLRFIDHQVIDIQVVPPAKIVLDSQANSTSDAFLEVRIEKSVSTMTGSLDVCEVLVERKTASKLVDDGKERPEFFLRMTLVDLNT
ncbi:MAG: hypothetical protein ND895_15160 [Pyrinomonadaceae bacterium]|nr:hypothetical protein [Pyrinomonadaceae bacterium]